MQYKLANTKLKFSHNFWENTPTITFAAPLGLGYVKGEDSGGMQAMRGLNARIREEKKLMSASDLARLNFKRSGYWLPYVGTPGHTIRYSLVAISLINPVLRLQVL